MHLKDMVMTNIVPIMRLRSFFRTYVVGETVTVLVSPKEGVDHYEFWISCFENVITDCKSNVYTFSVDTPGRYQIKARCCINGEYTQWSIGTSFAIVEPSEDVDNTRSWEHYKASYIVGSKKPSIVNPFRYPPKYPKHDKNVKWFRTPCYEGGPLPLFNEVEDYFRDPLKYYVTQIKRLVDAGVEFRVWNDIVENKKMYNNKEVILQFDMDGGPKSMERVFRKLKELGVKASIFVFRHSRLHGFRIEEYVDFLQEAESLGWTIGYHNGTLMNLGILNPTKADIIRARDEFVKDVEDLRKFFNIKVYGRHGGNHPSRLVKPPAELGVVNIDSTKKFISKSNITHSDGGVDAVPGPLTVSVSKMCKNNGRFHIRTHPAKYGNFYKPYEYPPVDHKDKDWVDKELTKQEEWVKDRIREYHPHIYNYSYIDVKKSISRNFSDHNRKGTIWSFLKTRKKYRRDFPYYPEDPRVFWWNMLAVNCKESTKVLNIGTQGKKLYVDLKLLMNENVEFVELDIDPKKNPSIVCDIEKLSPDMYNLFDTLLWFGVAGISNPSIGIEKASLAVQQGGLGLFGFNTDVSIVRGSLWYKDRITWRKELEPLKYKDWSYDKKAVLRLLNSKWDIEAMEFIPTHCFVIARRR